MKESVVKKIKSLLTVNFLLYVIVSVCIIVAIAGCIDRAFFYRISNGSSNTSFIMENEVEYAQKIKSNGDELKSLALTFGTFQQEKQGKIEISIKDAKGNILQRWEIDAASVQDNTIREFGVDKPVLLSEDNEYYITVKHFFEGDNQIALYATTNGGSIVAGDSSIDNTAIYFNMTLENIQEKESWKNVYIISMIFVVVLGVLFLDFGSMKLRNILFAFVGIMLVVRMLDNSVLQRVDIESNIVSPSSSVASDTVGSNESKEYGFSVMQTSFDKLTLYVSESTDYNIEVLVKNSESGVIYYDGMVPAEDIVYSSDVEKIAVPICFESKIPKGKYQITVTNHGSNNIDVDFGENGLNLRADKTSYMPYGIIIIIIVIISVMMIFVTGYAIHRFDIDKIYLSIIIPLGLVYLIVFSPWSTPDSETHFLAAYRCSNIILGYEDAMEWSGRQEDIEYYMNTWGRDINPTVEGYINVYDDFDLKCQKSEIIDMPIKVEHMEYYSLLNYLPLGIGYAIARLLNLSTLMMMILGRVVYLAVYIVSMYYAVKVTPVGKGIFAFVSLLPISLMMSSGVNYDGMVVISSLCFTASVFNLMKNNESKKALVSTVLWAFLLGSIKGGGYLILLPLIFVLYNKDDKKKSLLTMLYILIAGLGSVLLFDVIIPAGSELFQLGVEGNGRLTASYALEHPRGFLDMTINSYIRDLDFLVLNMAGSHLARLEFAIPSVVVIMLLVLIILYAINEEDSLALHKGCKSVFWLIIMVGIISTPAMLLSWTNVGSKTIEGLQGRYYLPLLPLLYFVLTKFSLHNPMDEEQKSVVQKKIIIWYLGISCLAIFYMLRLYVTR